MSWSVRNLDNVKFEVPAINNIIKSEGLDLTGLPYHGGSTLSSGALPKWDLLDRKFMVKRASFDEFGNMLTDCINEALVFRFCSSIGVSCAEYHPTIAKYRCADSDDVIVSTAVITKIFDGLVHYKDVRLSLGLGKDMDELLEIYHKFDVGTGLNDMLAIDFFFGQQDRHSKNIGFVGSKLSPIFDSGACLYFDLADELLEAVDISKIQRHKTFAKPMTELLAFSLHHTTKDFGFELDASYLKTCFFDVLASLSRYYTPNRLHFIKKFVGARMEMLFEICRTISS